MPPLVAILADAMDGFSSGVAVTALFLFPMGIFHPVYGTLQLGCIFFVWIWGIRRYRRKHRAGRSRLSVLVSWLIGGYVLTTTATNLLLMLVMS